MNPERMSQRELDEYLDKLVEQGLDDSKDFHRAYSEWERREAAG